MYILLEIDNIVMEFVRLTKLNSILIKIDYGLHGVREALKSREIYSHQVIKRILVKKEMEVDVDAYPADTIGPLYYDTDLLTQPLNLGPPSAVVPDGPGLGVELDEKLLLKYRVDR